MRSRYSTEAKSGYVYVGNSTRRDGTVKQYTGSTTRTVRIREREHKRAGSKKNSKTWTGKGTDLKITGYFKSKNPRRDEKKLKGMSRSERNKFIFTKNKASTSTRRKKTTYRKPSMRGRNSRPNYRSRRNSRRTYRSRRW